MVQKIVYALSCPETGRVYYVGKSDKGLQRPYSHYNSHNEDVKEWIRSLKTEPVVLILERHCDDIEKRESYWINEMCRRNEPILNRVIPTEKQLKYAAYKVSDFIKLKRKEIKLTQKEFAEKCGVGLRLIREIEQGKESCRIDKLLQILDVFGATLVPVVK